MSWLKLAGMPTCPGKNYLPIVWRELGYEVGYEIGVQSGKFSEHILSYWPGHLHMVDPYHSSDRYLVGGDPAAMPDATVLERDEAHENMLAEALARTDRYRGRRRHIRASSLDAAADPENPDADFAFIDAAHDRASVIEDCRAWWEKLRPGGMLCGHDYFIDAGMPWVDVVPAVNQFAKEVGRDIEIAPDDPCWIIPKNAP